MRGMIGAGSLLVLMAGWAQAQTTSTFAPTRDTYVDSSTAGTTTNFGNSDRLSVERNSSGLNERSYIHFDVSSVPASDTVSSATLRVWVIRENSGGSALDRYEILEVLSPWTDSLTWDASQGLSIGPLFLQMDSVDYGTENLVTPPQPVDFDVTALVQGWVAAGSNNGIMIRLENTASADIRFASMNHGDATIHPELTVVHTAGSGGGSGGGTGGGTGGGSAGTGTSSSSGKSSDDGACGCGSAAAFRPSRILLAFLAPVGLLFLRRRGTIA